MRLWEKRYGDEDQGWLSDRACVAIILAGTAFLVGIVLLAMLTPEP
jgi:hypothetical protein